jgi:hypothetical protein
MWRGRDDLRVLAESGLCSQIEVATAHPFSRRSDRRDEAWLVVEAGLLLVGIGTRQRQLLPRRGLGVIVCGLIGARRGIR